MPGVNRSIGESMSEAKKRTFKNFPDNFTLGQCDEVFERNGFKRDTSLTENFSLVNAWNAADAIMTLEADRDTLLKALKEIIGHVEDNSPRVGNQCTLCHTYRMIGHDAISQVEDHKESL